VSVRTIMIAHQIVSLQHCWVCEYSRQGARHVCVGSAALFSKLKNARVFEASGRGGSSGASRLRLTRCFGVKLNRLIKVVPEMGRRAEKLNTYGQTNATFRTN